ncbi:MAG: response regulator, partial [Gammaproteobacteria bacterium]|nr:response regulator [Gammaproteobacteria bacterium]
MARILCVDDSQSIRDLMVGILNKENHSVTTASDGVEAINIARDNEFDLALLDVNMPNMNGLSLLSKLRNLEHFKFTPIVMVTTETSEYRKNKARNTGATGWLAKPFT